jgi:phosphoribosylanthranilate isomerase
VAHFKVKICGLTSEEDGLFCSASGASLAGFIFAKKSPRYVSPEKARLIPTPGLKRVGVFVEQTPCEILEIMERAGLDLAQFHGDQKPGLFPDPQRVIRVFWPEKYSPNREALEEDFKIWAPYAHTFLFDAGTSWGGHGRTLKGGAVKGLNSPRPYLLAGGLGPDNLEAIFPIEDPMLIGFDFNSGVERAQGLKDHLAITRIFEILSKLDQDQKSSGSATMP